MTLRWVISNPSGGQRSWFPDYLALLAMPDWERGHLGGAIAMLANAFLPRPRKTIPNRTLPGRLMQPRWGGPGRALQRAAAPMPPGRHLTQGHQPSSPGVPGQGATRVQLLSTGRSPTGSKKKERGARGKKTEGGTSIDTSKEGTLLISHQCSQALPA